MNKKTYFIVETEVEKTSKEYLTVYFADDVPR